jgi:hypothetical protein
MCMVGVLNMLCSRKRIGDGKAEFNGMARSDGFDVVCSVLLTHSDFPNPRVVLNQAILERK